MKRQGFVIIDGRGRHRTQDKSVFPERYRR